ncbi:MAG: pyruvate dehydrogenase (acetyl-transferring) E1 component subunit alpha [Deferrisomatales bacterium]|nr:pyruvate dehydrogenase (acetyl-transferring) E1 component subunit alpha [Deferrisomatales bacterium]
MNRREVLLAYRRMRLARAFETKVAELYQKGRMGGFCHLYTGEEAVAVGALWPLRPDDHVLGSYRDHVYLLVRGTDPGRVMAELYGHSDGCCKGLGGSMHLYDRERNFHGGYAIVAGECPVAVGLGLGVQYRQGDQVVVCFFGDGATNQGVYHEALNLAGLWKLPIVFVCENNEYAIGTSVRRSSAVRDLARKASVYGMPAERVDGMDFFKMVAVTERAVARARKGEGPTFIEARCYRYRGHSMSDPATYRSKEEVELWRSRDVLDKLRAQIRNDFEVPDEEFERIDAEVRREVEAAVAFAEAGRELTLEEARKLVYVEGPVSTG